MASFSDDVFSQSDVSSPLLPSGFTFQTYVVECVLGSGTSATVYRVKCTSTGDYMAFKCFVYTEDTVCVRESGFLTLLKDVIGVSKCTEIVTIPDVMNGFIMPFYKNGTLEDYVLNSFKSGSLLTETYFMSLLKTLFDIVKNSVDKDICNCDIKPANIIIDDDGKPIIADFGLAKILGVGQCQGETEYPVYTQWYRAPMSFRKYRYSLLTEVWALLVSILHVGSISENSCNKGQYYYRFYSCQSFIVFQINNYNRPCSQFLVDRAIDSVFSKKEYADFFKKWLNIERTKQMMSNFDEETKNAFTEEFSSDLEAILVRPADCQRDD